MKIEVLYPELTNIYGDLGNIRYLEKVVKDIEIIYTGINEEPKFNKEKIDMIYLGSMPEVHQEIIVEKLLKYKKKIKELMENNTIFLFTGSAIEIVGNYIEEKDKKINTLGLFDIYFKRDYENRHNSFYVGVFDNLKIVGNKSQFTFAYGNNNYPFLNTTVGVGMNMSESKEGIHYNNFFATSLLGPILVLNPFFTKYLLGLKGIKSKLRFESDAIDAYQLQVELLEKPDAQIILGDHY